MHEGDSRKGREVILDCAYMNGKQGEKVDHLTKEERWRRYPASPENPEGTGQYLLEVGNGRLYLDALKQDWALGSYTRGWWLKEE